MRGGTSKAVFMRMADVPSEPAMRDLGKLLAKGQTWTVE